MAKDSKRRKIFFRITKKRGEGEPEIKMLSAEEKEEMEKEENK